MRERPLLVLDFLGRAGVVLGRVLRVFFGLLKPFDALGLYYPVN